MSNRWQRWPQAAEALTKTNTINAWSLCRKSVCGLPSLAVRVAARQLVREAAPMTRDSKARATPARDARGVIQREREVHHIRPTGTCVMRFTVYHAWLLTFLHPTLNFRMVHADEAESGCGYENKE